MSGYLSSLRPPDHSPAEQRALSHLGCLSVASVCKVWVFIQPAPAGPQSGGAEGTEPPVGVSVWPVSAMSGYLFSLRPPDHSPAEQRALSHLGVSQCGQCLQSLVRADCGPPGTARAG